MPMIDIGIKIEVATASGTTKPVAAWTKLEGCVAMPALIQPSSKISYDFIGDDYIGEMLGKKTVSGLDFVFAYDGTASGDQFKKLRDMDKNNEQHWFRVTYPDGTKFEMLAEFEVTLVAPAPSAEIDYTLSVVPIRTTIDSDIVTELILVVEKGGTDPLNS